MQFLTLARFLCLLLVGISSLASAEERALDHLYSPAMEEKPQLLLDRILTHARNSEYDYALTLSQSLLDKVDPMRRAAPGVYGQLLVNHGIIQSADGEYKLSLPLIESGLALMEQRANPFSPSLVNALMARGLTMFAADDMEGAEDSFHRVQHIMHRHGGVYAEDQIPVIDWLTKTSLKRGEPVDADRLQRFSLRVAENAYGPDSIELLPLLDRLGGYFASRGSTIPPMVGTELRLQRDMLFKLAVNMYLRSVAIIEQNYGENDLRLVQPLRGLANARMLQITNRKYAEEALERSLAIVESNPGSDLSDRAQALVDLGDLYVITSDTRAGETYLSAWHMLQESPETQEIANLYFSTPLRLFPRESPMLYIDRQPDNTEAGDPLFVELAYNVTTSGKVSGIRLIDKNVPNEHARVLRHKLKTSRYRPRISEGEILETEDLSLRQPFQVFRRFASTTAGDDGDNPAPNSDAIEDVDSTDG